VAAHETNTRGVRCGRQMVIMGVLIILTISAVLIVSSDDQCVAADLTEYKAGAWTYVLNDNGTARITAWDSEADDNGLSGTVLTIPGTLKADNDTGDRVVIDFTSSKLKYVQITEVKIPSSLENIYTQFRGFTSLETIDLSNIKDIGDQSFEGCTSLKNVTMPSSEFSIGFSSFSRCASLTQIDLTNLKSGETVSGFDGCTSLKNVIFSKEPYSIGGGAFRDCISLESIDVSGATAFGGVAFSGCSKLKSVTMPSTEYTGGLSQGLFAGCISLTSIDLGNIIDTEIRGYLELTYLGYTHPFSGSGVKYLSAESKTLTSKSGVIFSKDGKTLVCAPCITEYAVPFGVTSIEKYAFAYSILESVDLNEVKNISKAAFMRCKSLATVMGSPISVEQSAFFECISLTSIDLSELTFAGEPPTRQESTGYGSFEECISLKTIDVSKLAGRGTAFTGCDSLEEINASKSSIFQSIDGILYNKDITELAWFPTAKTGHVILPSTVTSLGERALSETKITSINMLGITNIGDYAFYKCQYLTDVDLSKQVIIGNYTFYECTELANVDLSLIKSVGDSGFYGCSKLQTVDMTNMTYVGEKAFYLCSSLLRVIAPILEEIGDSAFVANSKILIVDVSSAKNIGNGAFGNCQALKSIDMSSVVSIGNSAFNMDKALEIVILPTTDYTIGILAFGNCTSLSMIDLTGAVQINAGAFSDSGISYIFAPDLVEIDGEAFNRCLKLLYAYMPKLTTVKMQAFNKCSALETFYAPMLKTISFSGCTNLRNLIVADAGENTENFGSSYLNIFLTSDCDDSITLNSSSADVNFYRYADAAGWEGSSIGTFFYISYVRNGTTVLVTAVPSEGQARRAIFLDEGKIWTLDGEEYNFARQVTSDIVLTEGIVVTQAEDTGSEEEKDMTIVLAAVASVVAIIVLAIIFLMRRPA